MMPTWRLWLLGRFQIIAGDTLVTTVNTPRLQSLLSWLVLHRHAPQPRRQIAFCLWPDLPEARARANLRKLLHQLQQALPGVLEAGTHTLQWSPGLPLVLDAAEFEALAALPDDLERAVELYGGDLLPDCYDDWIVPERERLRQIYLLALERLIRRKEEEGDYGAALGYLRRLLLHDPLREEIHRHVMRLHLLNGDRAAALRAFQNCATVLRRELDVEPGPATRQVYEQVLDSKEPLLELPPLAGPLPLVGRTAEWNRLQQAWHTAARGRAHLVLIGGEAGIGKTRLAEELLVWADRHGIPASSAHCYATEATSAYAPLVAWLRDRPLAHLAPAWLAEVARLVPELADRVPGLPACGPLTEPWQRHRFHDALARAVLGPDLGLSVPLLLLIEDLHWADGDSLEWLHYLLRLNPRARLLVVSTVRPDQILPGSALATLLTDLRRSSLLAEIELQTLAPAETASLAGQVLGQKVEGETAARFYRETEGNPLFVVEYARAGLVAPAQSSPAGEAVLPPAVQAAVAARLAQLSPAARQVMELAAVIGREFTFDLLLASGIESGEEPLVQALDELWQRRLIRERGRAGYDLAHNKLGQVAYAGLSGTRRRWLHKRAAEALLAVSGRHAGPLSGQIGRHYEQAGEDRAAAHWLGQAGQVAWQMRALAEALGYFERALALLPDADLAGRFDLLLAREKVYHLQAARPEQVRDLAALAELAEALGDPSRQAQVALQRGVYLRETSDFPAAIEAARAALSWIGVARQAGDGGSAAAPPPPEELARLEVEAYYLWGATLEYQGQPEAAIGPEQTSLELARRYGLRQQEARALYLLAHISETMLAARDYLEAALPLLREVGEASGEAGCLDSLGYVHLWLGDYDSALAYYRQSWQLARQIFFRRGEVNVLFHLGHFYNHMGDYVTGQGYLQQALAMARQDQDRRRIGYHLVSQAVSRCGLGQAEAAREQVLEALAILKDIGDAGGESIAWLTLSDVWLDLEQPVEAEAAVRQAISLTQPPAESADALHSQVRLARTLLAQGNLAGAQELVEGALHAQHAGSDVGDIECGPVPFYMGCYRVLRAAGDDRALDLLALAHEHLQAQATRIQDQALRRSFLEGKRENRQVLFAWQQEQSRSGNA